MPNQAVQPTGPPAGFLERIASQTALGLSLGVRPRKAFGKRTRTTIRKGAAAMGFASYQEDILLRAAENGFDAGTAKSVSSPLPGGGSAEPEGADAATHPRSRTITLRGEEARRYVLKHLCGAKEFAYLQVIETRTGHLVQEFPYRQRAEVEARLAQIEVKYPGVLHLLIVKRLVLPEDHA